MSKNASMGQGHLPSIDGWRAICLMMVMGSHCGGFKEFKQLTEGYNIPFFFNGHLGVRMFFVISGFLITHLLIRERQKTGKISLRNFYIRRALRILPVYFSYLSVIALLQVFSVIHQEAITWFSSLVFIVNFLPRTSISGHLWSLSVEEQFYLIWPFSFLWLMHKKRVIYLVLMVPFIVAISCNMLNIMKITPDILHPLFQHQSSLCNFDALSAGCVAAFLFSSHADRIKSWSLGGKGLISLVVSTCMLIIPTLNIEITTGLKVVLPSIQAAGFSLLLLISISNPNWFKALNWKPIVQLGVISYSVYIWQQIFCALPCDYHQTKYWWMSFPYWIGSAIAAGFVSFYCLEKPLLKLRNRYRRESQFGAL